MSNNNFQFGDLVIYQEKQYRFIGMDEDGMYQLVRKQDIDAFDIIGFEYVAYQNWNEIELIQKTPIENPYPDTKSFKSFTQEFCEKHKITKKELLKLIEKYKKDMASSNQDTPKRDVG